MNLEERQRAFERVEQATNMPMLLLALAFIPVLAVPMLIDLSPDWELRFEVASWLIWAAFALELTVKTYLAPNRVRYLLRNWFTVLIVVLPFLRPLRLFRVVQALRLLKLMVLVSALTKAWSTARFIFGRHGLSYTLLVALVLVLAATVAVTHFERDGGGSIDSFETALWWAAVTATTVGYGDTFPVTPAGRGIAVFLMLIGITVFGLVTANIAAFFIQARDEKDEITLGEIAARLDRLQTQIEALQGEIVALRTENPPIGEAVSQR